MFIYIYRYAGEKWDLPYHFYRPSQEKYSADQVIASCPSARFLLQSSEYYYPSYVNLVMYNGCCMETQWLWDSGAHMITWSNKNVTNSILDLRTMLQMQQDDGKLALSQWGECSNNLSFC